MRFQEISESSAGTSTAGSVATVAKPFGEVQSRTEVRGLQPADKVIKGTAKKKGPYANSIAEGKKVDEAKLDEEDKIIAVGKGKKLKTGLHGKSEEPKLSGFKSPFRANDWAVTDSRGNEICMASTSNVAPVIADALNKYVSMNEGAGVIAGGLQYENVEGDQEESEKNLRYSRSRSPVADEIRKKLNPNQKDKDQLDELSKDTIKDYVKKQPERIKGPQGLARTNPKKAARIVDPENGDIRRALTKLKDPKYGNAEPKIKEGAKVDRMVKHIKSSEKKAGKSSSEAENIAWATANKRGMLDNKNKKAK